MKIKFSNKELDYLIKNNKIDLLNKINDNSKSILINIDDDKLFDLYEWVYDQLLTYGFDENYELNKMGIFLQNLLDKLNV